MTAARVSELLQHLADCDLPAELVQWLRDLFAAWRRGGDLDSALGLDDDALDLDERDKLIRACVKLCPGDAERDQLYFSSVLWNATGGIPTRPASVCCGCCASVAAVCRPAPNSCAASCAAADRKAGGT